MLEIGYLVGKPRAVGVTLADEYEALRPTLPNAFRKVCRHHVTIGSADRGERRPSGPLSADCCYRGLYEIVNCAGGYPRRATVAWVDCQGYELRIGQNLAKAISPLTFVVDEMWQEEPNCRNRQGGSAEQQSIYEVIRRAQDNCPVQLIDFLPVLSNALWFRPQHRLWPVAMANWHMWCDGQIESELREKSG
jgi:hypothetical protein